MTRVVAGSAGGRRLQVPPGRGTRPTSARAREGLFSTLEAIRGGLAGAAFLDLYAGSGAVGLEAASRGAATVTLVERDPKALAALRANAQSLALGGVQVVAAPVHRVLADAASTAYDVVFLDPPYAQPVDVDLVLLTQHGWLAPDAVVVVERALRGGEVAWPSGIVADRSRRYGDTGLWYGRRP